MVPVSLARWAEAITRIGWRVCVGWSMVMHDPMLAMLSPTKMNFDSLRGGTFLRLGCSSALRSLWPLGGWSLDSKPVHHVTISLCWLWSPLKCWCLGMFYYKVQCGCVTLVPVQRGLLKTTVDGERMDVLYIFPGQPAPGGYRSISTINTLTPLSEWQRVLLVIHTVVWNCHHCHRNDWRKDLWIWDNWV